MPKFAKDERLCSRKLIELLIANGKSFIVFPLRFTFLVTQLPPNIPAQVVFTVSKKRFKRANKRNAIKRKLREAYRLQKEMLYLTLQEKSISLCLMVNFVSNEDVSFNDIGIQVGKGFQKITKALP